MYVCNSFIGRLGTKEMSLTLVFWILFFCRSVRWNMYDGESYFLFGEHILGLVETRLTYISYLICLEQDRRFFLRVMETEGVSKTC